MSRPPLLVSLVLAALLALVPAWTALVPDLPETTRRQPATAPDAAVAADDPAPPRDDCAAGPSAESRREAAACLLSGRGMWIWEFDKAEGGDPHAIVAKARQHGISHVLIRGGSSRMGFYARKHLDALLPVAHAAGIKVLIWDFPYLEDPDADALRVWKEIRYTTPDGHRADGLVPDIEEPAQGVTLTRARAERFAFALRSLVGEQTVLIATTPRPTPPRLANYPYAEIAPYFDAFAPMVYWGYDDPASATSLAIERLSKYGLPVAPVGQSYDMTEEGGPGHPSVKATNAFMNAAEDHGAPGVSFWSWQHAAHHNWHAIRDFAAA